MNTKSIRFRILVWYSLILFITTAFVFLIFYLVTRQILYAQVDSELTNHASLILQTVKDHVSDLHITSLQGEVSNQFKDTPGMVVVLLDQNGSTVLSSISMDTPFISYDYLFQQAKLSRSQVFIDQSVSNMPMRFVAEPIRDNNTFLGVLLVAHPIEAIQKSLNFLPIVLAVILAFLVFPILLLGSFLTNKIMLPIAQISDEMEEINSEDLTKRIKYPQTNDEIEKLAISFNNLLERVQKSFEREKQFIGDVAHELKTPVATMRGGIELALSKDRPSKEYKKALEENLIDVNRLSTLIKNVLDLAWIGAGNSNIDNNHFNLSSALGELKEIATRLASARHITIKGEISGEINVPGSEDKITRAILNVIDNAIKYTPSKGTVFISLHKAKNNAVIEIKDSGVGIPEKELEHIFERFYRGTNTSKTLGSGLGLAIAHGIIKTHNGDIEVKSKVGKGTLVVVKLPLMIS